MTQSQIITESIKEIRSALKQYRAMDIECGWQEQDSPAVNALVALDALEKEVAK